MKSEKNLKDKTVVITGASSGIGLAAAHAFAREGANVVLAARNDTVLQEIASECEALGGRATPVMTDVSNPESIQKLFEHALSFYGAIDVWINNAGVGALGEFDKTPLEAQEQVIRTNLLGPFYGAYFVIPYFKRVGKGIMINTNSTGAFVGSPLSVSYSASKFGLRGFSEALRYELKFHTNIHICDVYASFVDTPGVQHAANYIGKEAGAPPPLVAPEKMAEAMVKLAYRPRRSIHLGGQDRLGRLAHAVFPELTGRIMNKFERLYFKKAKEVEKSSGNLFKPSVDDGPHIHNYQ